MIIRDKQIRNNFLQNKNYELINQNRTENTRNNTYD